MTPSSEDIAGQSGVPVAVTSYRVSLDTKRSYSSSSGSSGSVVVVAVVVLSSSIHDSDSGSSGTCGICCCCILYCITALLYFTEQIHINMANTSPIRESQPSSTYCSCHAPRPMP